VDQGLVLLITVVFLGVLFASLERNPRIRRSMNLNIAFTVAFLVVYLGLQAAGVEQLTAFVTTLGLFALALVVLFALQRARRTI
jgi:hypothetical protein